MLPEQWDTKQVVQWLRGISLNEYENHFVLHHITGKELLELTNEDLKEMSIVSVGHRKRILKEISSLALGDASTEHKRVAVDKEQEQQQIRVGIDFGGVICGGSDPTSNTRDTAFFSDNYLETPPVEKAFDVIKFIVSKYGPENVFIVSKASARVIERSMNWLKHQQFFTTTNFDPKNIHFCKERHEKEGICNKLQINVFIDDHIECLIPMIDKNNETREQDKKPYHKLYWFRPSEKDVQRNRKRHVLNTVRVPSWQHIQNDL